MPQRKQRKTNTPRDARSWWKQAFDLEFIRQFPFWMLAFVTIILANRKPYGRKPAEFNFDISWDSIAYSTLKPIHILACAILMVLGVIAYKWKRWWVAAILTMLIGLSWEISQMTVAGHYARLTDLIPDFLGVVLGFLIVEGFRHAMKPEDYLFG